MVGRFPPSHPSPLLRSRRYLSGISPHSHLRSRRCLSGISLSHPWEKGVSFRHIPSLTHGSRRCMRRGYPPPMGAGGVCAEATHPPWENTRMYAQRLPTHHGRPGGICAEATHPPWEESTMRRGYPPTMGGEEYYAQRLPPTMGRRVDYAQRLPTHHGREVPYAQRPPFS